MTLQYWYILSILSFYLTIAKNNRDFTKIDWCAKELQCKENINTACRRKGCPTANNCFVEPISDEFKQAIVDVHNKWRNILAKGQEQRKPIFVADMMTINYNYELEFMAQCHANECEFKIPDVHDKCRRVPSFNKSGQNVHKESWPKYVPEIWLGVKNAITAKTGWYDEIEDLHESNYEYYTNAKAPGVPRENHTGHYSQFVWGKTAWIGCGAVSFQTGKHPKIKADRFMLVCNYGPGGNLVGAPMFTKGTPCSKCPKNVKCNGKYDGLCGESFPVKKTNSIQNNNSLNNTSLNNTSPNNSSQNICIPNNANSNIQTIKTPIILYFCILKFGLI